MRRILVILALVIAAPSNDILAQGRITTPMEEFGHNFGDDYWLANYQQIAAYWRKLDAQSDRMIIQEIGKTAEGRPHLMAIVTSPENHRNLERYRQISMQLGLAQGLTDEAARILAREGKAVVWFQLGTGGTIICLQFFDADGDPITTPLLANALPGNNRTPTAAFDDRGNLHVLWTRDEGAGVAVAGDRLSLPAVQGSSVVGRTFDPQGQPQSGEVTVSSSAATGESSEPESDSDLSGNQVVSIQLQATNLFNTVRFGAIDSVVNSPTFGQVVTIRPMRTVQLGVRFRF